MGGNDLHNLQRFLQAQQGIYEQVLSELRSGRKTSHWMWFIFPQVQGLGHTETSLFFAILSLEEATAYLKHPVLGPRLRECTGLLLKMEGKSANQIFGSPDDLKLKSSMTLFAQAHAEDDIFQLVVDRYFGGKLDARTLELLDID